MDQLRELVFEVRPGDVATIHYAVLPFPAGNILYQFFVRHMFAKIHEVVDGKMTGRAYSLGFYPEGGLTPKSALFAEVAALWLPDPLEDESSQFASTPDGTPVMYTLSEEQATRLNEVILSTGCRFKDKRTSRAKNPRDRMECPIGERYCMLPLDGTSMNCQTWLQMMFPTLARDLQGGSFDLADELHRFP